MLSKNSKIKIGKIKRVYGIKNRAKIKKLFNTKKENKNEQKRDSRNPYEKR